MQTTEWYKSKTIMLNLAIAVLSAVLAALSSLLQSNPAGGAFTLTMILVAAVAAINVLLRFATNTPIGSAGASATLLSVGESLAPRALAPVVVPSKVIYATPPPSDPPAGVLTPDDLKAIKNQVINAMTHSGDVRAYWLSVIGQAGVLTEATVHASPGLYTRISETTHEELVKYFGAQDMNPPTPVAVDPQSA